MIIQCEQCATRFKVADDKVSAQGIRVRCSKCQHVFTARADDATSLPSGAVSRPSGIFAAPAATPTSGKVVRGSSNPPSSGSVQVPQASLSGQDPTFDPFSPPSARAGESSGPTSSSSSPASDMGSFSLDDAPDAAGDRSFFGQPNQTIGGFDDEDVPEPPSFDDAPAPPAPPPPESAAFGGPDPFASPLSAASAGPFASQEPLAETAVFSDPFATQPSASAASALPTAGDPFAASASADPFAQADPFAAGHAAFPPPSAATTTPPGADPFSTGNAPAFGGVSPAGEDDPFNGLGVDVDPYAVDVEEPPTPPPPPTTAAAPPPPPVAAVAKEEVAAPQKPQAAKSRFHIPEAVPRVAWAALQACILVAFLSISLVWGRGGSLDDLAAGNGLDVVLGRASALGEAGAPVHVDEVVVARRPVAAAADLVVVSGFVVNGGSEDAPGAQVTVRFGELATESAWANTGIDGVDLAAQASAEALLALNDRLPALAKVAVGQRAPFVVLARGIPDGATADVTVEVKPPPAPPPPVLEPAAHETPPPGKGKRLRRRGKRGPDDAAPARRRAPAREASR